uniref:DIS3-like exonuclease 2 n=1 Tax=Kwoniella pini CBS 10737 TaxID=1296096 RepID=A0A1B9I4X1_9TREE|nr:uncharacterized protein I206_03866 [Kwoniella pini CBS 10737]OCF50541.1 hypothetical protein I206_03866 [Kwoniella pini CBS 10737]
MADSIVAPTPQSGSLSPSPNTLAPPSNPSRPSSANSQRSNSSRGGRSSNISRSNSNASSRGGSENGRGNPDKKKQSGPTTTISGGVSLGASGNQPKKSNGGGKKGRSPTPREATLDGEKSGNHQQKDGNKSKKPNSNRKPNPINTNVQNPNRPSSQNSNSKGGNDTAPKSIHTAPSAPRTAMEAAVDAATKKHHAQSGGDALASLQKMISDLKTLPNSGPSTGSSNGSRSVSASATKESPISAATNQTTAEAVAIPNSSTSANSNSAKKLKADAPSFTPSFNAATSPVNSQIGLSISPIAPIPPSSVLHPRSVSHGSAANNRRTSTGSVAGSGFNQNMATSPIQVYPNPLPPIYQNLSAHPEVEEEHSQMSFAQQAELQYQQQQLLAAQQQQYQYIQLLQAQIAANQQLAQQQAQHQHQQQQQQQQMGSFIAPRFQALAQQRAAQQQQQTALQLAQAQQLYELQQAQLLKQQRDQEEARAKAIAETMKNQPVFAEDDEELEARQSSVGPTGRPQLAPSFTFGAKPKHVKSESISERGSARDSMSPPSTHHTSPPVVVNRSEGIGGAAATGLAGLAARAHKRTGSEMSSAMQQQLAIQQEIEALQAKQKALMQEDISSQGSTPLSQLNTALQSKQTPSQTLSRHRRVQSSLPSATIPTEMPDRAEKVDQPRALRTIGEMPPPPVPSNGGHSRRHSVNVFNKTAGHGVGFGSMGGEMAIPEDYVSNGDRATGHHRSGSRSGFESGNWRVSGGGSAINNNVGNIQVADLAAAQAQLQSLAQFRAAAGGGHSKMASFSFPNMLPNLLAATTLQTPIGQSLWQQQQSFQMQLQQTSQGPQRKSLFAPYLPQASLPPLLQAGKLVVGVLRVNKKNRSDAYVATDVLEADIYICGSKDRNRALEGDIVAVELLDVDEVWGTKKDKEEKKRKKEENAVYDLKPSQAKKIEKKKDDVEVEGQGLTLFEDEEVNDDTKPTYAGHVVAVVERMPGQLFSGQLGVLRPSSAATKEKQELERRERDGDRGGRRDEPEQRPKIVWFKPTDKRVPLIAIPTEQAPSDFIDNPDAYGDKLFVATIKRWPITSLHPFGTLVEELGPIGDVEVETSALLKDCNFPTEEFTDLTMKCLPPLPWSIPDREYEVRTDLRDERTFTIDPSTAKDLDDALSVKQNEDGTTTVGVHIADVSYFVKANTAIDREARKRATSVYLVQRAVPMLPPQLSEELCSLVPDVERLTFSAIFTFDEEGNVKDKKFAKSIIKSNARLSYSDAQDVINGGSLDSTKGAVNETKEIESDVKILHELSTKIKRKRLDAGAILSNKLKVSFAFDDNGKPVDVDAVKKTEANSLVEEFMLLANISVAHLIANGLPEQALLRRHEAPIDRRLEGFVTRAHKLGFEIDATSAGTLQKSFEGIKDMDTVLCLELLKKKAMQRARYFCTGMLDIAKYSHWALNTPLYTHFTSPIRRYADVLVHRMLDACLTTNQNDVKFLMDRDQVAKCAQQCNMKKASAKLAEEQSIHLYLCLLIHDLTERYGPVIRQAKVTGVLDAAFDVVIPEFGIEKRVHVDKMPVENVVYDEHKDILSLYWTRQNVLSYLAETTEDPHLLKIKALGEKLVSGSSTTQSLEENSLFDTAGSNQKNDKNSKQYLKSSLKSEIGFEGLRSDPSGKHKIQDIKELSNLPVIITSDITKSPPVLVVYACE